MSLTHINNGDTGLQARTKINNAFDAVDNLPLPTSALVQTTNGATTSIATISIGTYSVYSVEATISGYDATNDLAYGSQLFATFRKSNISPNPILQISTTDVYEKSEFSTATSHMFVNGDIDISVIGETSKTINWVVNYSVTKI